MAIPTKLPDFWPDGEHYFDDHDYVSRPPVRTWFLEFDQDGAPVVCTVTAPTEASAERIARQQLAGKHADFDQSGARLVACIER
jgi:hypothetical protein